jgi:hypothetical protein
MVNHSFCILDESLHADGIYDNLYSIVAGYLEKGYGVVYVAENNSPDKIIYNFKKGTISRIIDMDNYVKKGALTAIDYGSLYYSSGRNDEAEKATISNNNLDLANTSTLIKRWQSEIQNKRNNGYNKILIVGTCRAFSDKCDYDGLMAYEDAISHQLLLDGSSLPSPYVAQLPTTSTPTSDATTNDNAIIERICCYRTSGIERIPSLPVMASVFLSHNGRIVSTEKTKRNDGKSGSDSIKSHFIFPKAKVPLSSPPLLSATAIRSLNPYIIVESITQVIDKMMGSNTSNLILKTMKLIYQIDKDDIIRQPKLFVDGFVKIIGKDTANIMLNAILEEVKNQIIYGSNRSDNGI